MIGGLIAPIGLIIIFNFVMFIMVLRRITAVVKGKVTNKSKKEQFKKRLINAVSIFVLMGLTWVVGYLSVIEATSFIVQMLFCVINSMQGYVIFMLHVVRRAEVRQVWSSVFSSTKIRKQSYSSTQSPQNPRLSSSTDSRVRPNNASYGNIRYIAGSVPNVVSISDTGVRARFPFEPEFEPVSLLEENTLNGSALDSGLADEVDDALNIDSENENFYINRINMINEGIANPAGPNVADPDGGRNSMTRNTFANRYF